MSCKSCVFILVACLSGWCAGAKLVSFDLPKLPEIKPVTKLPAGFPTCVGTKVDLNQCIENGIEVAKPLLRAGIPEFSLPSLDPLVLQLYDIVFTNEIVKGHLDIDHLVIQGICESTVKNVNFTKNGNYIKVQLTTLSPNIRKEGTFEGELEILGMDLNPHGSFKGNSTGLSLDVTLEGKLIRRAGHKYLNLRAINIEPEVEDVSFETLDLGINLNSLLLGSITESWRSLYKGIWKETRETWEPVALHVANAYLNAIPFDLLIDTP